MYHKRAFPIEQVIKPKSEQSWAQRFRAITEKLAQGAKGLKQDQIDQVIDEAVTAVRCVAPR